MYLFQNDICYYSYQNKFRRYFLFIYCKANYYYIEQYYKFSAKIINESDFTQFIISFNVQNQMLFCHLVKKIKTQFNCK